MIERDSRYGSVGTSRLLLTNGRSVVYLRRRFVPRGDSLATLAEVTVTEADRLDLIASRTLGNAELFWRVCDANDAMKPDDLLAAPGRVLRVPLPGF